MTHDTSTASTLARAPRGREADRLLTAELLQEIRLLRETSSAAAVTARGAVNEVLAVETAACDSDGLIARQYRTMVGSVVVSNVSEGDVTVSSSPPSSGVGTRGAGQYPVRAGMAVSVPIGSRTVTIYGQAGAVVGLQVYTGRVEPMSGPC